MKEKQIKISQKLFLDVYRLLIELDEVDYQSDLKNAIEEQIEAKLNKMETHNLYTKYKTALPNSNEREKARLEYLKKAGINDDFISNSEIPY